MMEKPHIALWSGPRNLSTALMYSFFSRKDLKVFDEPLFGHFLKYTGVWRPSREEALKVMETNAQRVIERTFSQTSAFSKNIANHIEGLNLAFLLPLKNIILTRKPEEVLVSYTKHVEHPTMLDLAFEHQLKIIEFLKAQNQPFLIIEAADLQNTTAETLNKICDFAGIEFSEKMLSWMPGQKPIDGVWEKYWYQGVHRSTGFEKRESEKTKLPTSLLSLKNSCDLFYAEILNHK